MSAVARRIASVPVRSSTETWAAITNLLAQPGTGARDDLDAISGIASVLIAEEYASAAPIIVSGGSPRVRVYTVHGDDAPDAQRDESSLGLFPCDSDDWAISLPCGSDDLDEMTAAVADHPRVSIRDLTDGITLADDKASEAAATSTRPIIDLTEMERP